MYILLSFFLGIEGQHSLTWAFDKFKVDRTEKPCLIAWIHSHVGGSECCFSSIDNHTQYSYQKVHKGVLGLVVEINRNGKKGAYDFFELSSFGKKEIGKCSRQKNCITTEQHESCMGREFYQSAMRKVLFDDFYSIEVANFMLKVGIESHLPDTEASLSDSGKKGRKRQKNVQQSTQQNQDRPQTLPTESDFPTLGGTANPSPATPRGQIQDEFPALGDATRLPIPQAVAQTDEVTFQAQAAGKVF